MLSFWSGSKPLMVKIIYVDEHPGWRESFPGPGIVHMRRMEEQRRELINSLSLDF